MTSHAFLATLQDVSPLAAGALFASIWQGVLLTSALVLAFRWRRDFSPAFRTWAWLSAVVLISGLTVFSALWPHAATSRGEHAALHLSDRWSVALLAVWVTLSAWRGGRVLAGAVRVIGLLRRAEPVSVSARVAALLAGARRARLRTSAEVNRPSVVGFFRPCILLPAGLPEVLSEAELEHVVLHEMEHVRRWDDWVNLLQQLSLVLLPLNPALLWLDRTLCRERELACDDGVLRSTGARKAYAACLVKLAEDSLVRKGFALALSALGTRARESELMGRVRRILAAQVTEPAARRTSASRRWTAVAGTVALASLAAVSALHTPQWVRFDPVPVTVADVRAEAPALSPAWTAELPAPAVRASYNGRPARMVEARAIVEGPAASLKKAGRSAHRRPRAVESRAAAVRTVRATEMPRVLRLSAEAVGERAGTRSLPPAAGRVVMTEFEVSQPVYAAVAVGNGWLIFQL